MAENEATLFLKADPKGLIVGFKGGEKHLIAFQKKVEKGNKSLASMAKIMKGAAIAKAIQVATQAMKQFAAAAWDAAEAFAAQNKAEFQVRGAAKLAGKSNIAGSIMKQAKDFERLTGIQDQVIMSSQQIMLTYHNISESSFPRVMEAAVDLAAVFGNVEESTKKIGRAMDDPISGMQFLTEAGITFTLVEKERIKTLVKTNDLMGAQDLILGKLEEKFKGMAKVVGESAAGSMAKFSAAMQSVKEQLGEGIFDKFGDSMKRLTDIMNDMVDSGFFKFFAAASLKNIGTALKIAFAPLIAFIKIAKATQKFLGVKGLDDNFFENMSIIAREGKRGRSLDEQIAAGNTRRMAASERASAAGGVAKGMSTQEKWLKEFREQRTKDKMEKDRLAFLRPHMSQEELDKAFGKAKTPKAETEQERLDKMAADPRFSRVMAERRRRKGMAGEKKSSFSGGIEDAASMWKRMQVAMTEGPEAEEKKQTRELKQVNDFLDDLIKSEEAAAQKQLRETENLPEAIAKELRKEMGLQ